MRILVLGAGGIGGYFGGRLLQAGADVSFLVHETRAAQLRKHGLLLSSRLGDFRAPVSVILAHEVKSPFDLVILTSKAYDLDSAIKAIAPAIGEHTVVLPLLNGVLHIDTLSSRFGENHVLGGVAHLAVALSQDGVVQHLNDINILVFGERSGRPSPPCKALSDLLRSSTVAARLSQNILQDMWDKLVFLGTLAGITCLMRASIGEILETGVGKKLILQLLMECEQVATESGYRPNEDQLSRYRAQLTERGSTYTASMLRDIERGGRTEADHVLGDLLKRAQSKRLRTPLLEVAYTHLQSYEARRARHVSRSSSA